MSLLAQFSAQYNATGAQFAAQYVNTALVTQGRVDDFDSAIGTVGTITGSETLTPTITLIDDEQADLNPFGDGWLQVYVRVDGVSGKTPTFNLDFTNFRDGILTPSAPWKMVWRYTDDTDPGDGRMRPWTAFDNGTGVSPHVFSNNAAFAQDSIEVAVKPRYRYVDLQRLIAHISSTAMGHQLLSADANHVVNSITVSSATRPNSAPYGTLNQYGIRIEDESVSPSGAGKLNVVLLVMAHSSEDQGELAAEEFVHYFLHGTGTAADWLRQHTRMYLYSVNPSGRYYGKERWTLEDGGNEDPNRAWNDSGSEQVNAIKSAITTDVQSVDILFDWHGSYSLNGNGRPQEFMVYWDATPAQTFGTRLDAALSTASVATPQSTSAGTSSEYGTDVLNAQVSATLEFPIAAPNYPSVQSMYDYYAEAVSVALKAMVDNSELVLPAASGIPALGAITAGTITANSISFSLPVTY